MAGLLVNVVTLGVFFVSGAFAGPSCTADLSITAPKKIEVLEGSCLLIPCNYSTKDNGKVKFDNTRNIFGVWIKNDVDFGAYPNNVIFNSSQSNNKYSINITGNLKENDCTTLFSYLNKTHEDKFYFRIENEPFKATARCDALEITVKETPWRPRVKISGDLKENESVTITCSAVTSCPHLPPELTLNLQQDSHTQIKKNKDGTFTAEIQKSITLSDTHDGYKINCSVRYPVNEGKDFKTAETEETLRVSYAPKKTSASISPAGLVSAGTRVNLTCSSRASPPINFTWFKKSLHGDVKVAEGDFYSLNETDGGVYYCVAANDLGNQTSSDVHLDGSSDWMKILGGSIGVVFLVVCVCTVVGWRRTKQTNSSVQQLQKRTSSINEEENIHYGEITFTKRTPEASSNSVQESRLELDSVYSQVQPVNRLPQTDGGPEDLYAQVKKNNNCISTFGNRVTQVLDSDEGTVQTILAAEPAPAPSEQN